MIMLRKVCISHLLIIATLVFFAHRANALLITQSFDVVNVGNTDIELYLDPFDANLGALTNVYIDFRASSRIESDQFDCTVVDSACTVRGFAALYFYPGGGTFLTHTTDNSHTFLRGESNLFTVPLSTPGWWPNNLLSLSSFTEVSPRMRAHDIWRCERNCSNSEIGSGTQTLRGSLTYVYVPVPATLALLALGLVGIGVSRRSSAFSRAL